MVPAVQPTVVPAHTPIIWAEPATTAPTNQSRALRADRLEICRDFLRSTCTRNDMLKEGRSTEKMSGSLCKYAHPEKVSLLTERQSGRLQFFLIVKSQLYLETLISLRLKIFDLYQAQENRF